MDEDKLNEMLGRFVGDLGATITAGGVVIGHRLGLYRALVDGPGTADDLARRTGLRPAVRRGVAARPGGRRLRDATTRSADTWSMTEEQAFVLANPDGAVYAPGAYVLALGSLQAIDRIEEAFRTGAGVGWHEHDDEVFVGCEQFFRPGLPRQPGAELDPGARGRAGEARGRRQGRRRRLRARRVDDPARRAVPAGRSCWAATTTRSPSSSPASARPTPGSRTGSASRPRARRTSAGSGYDLVATFDCLHDMGDPLGAARHIRQALADDGTWLIVEPMAGDTVADNLNPVGRVYYGFSTFLCVPNALSQSGGYSLGAQAGEKAIGEVVAQAGFTRFRRAAETPFNLVFEARP